MSAIDLHIHSDSSSDGELSAKDIITQCKTQEMEIISITDHNSVRSVSEALACAGELRVLSGIELDCTFCGRGFHLLGYGFDHTCKVFTEIEENIFRQEQNASEEKISLFRKYSGIPLDTAEVMEASENGIVPGELIADILLSHKNAGEYELLRPYLPGGAKSDMPNVHFYWDYFSEGRPAYVPIHYLSLPEAIELIHHTGGVAVLAHPGQNLGSDDTLLYKMLSEKLDGIEVFSSYHTSAAARHYLAIAMQYNLLVTCGSDFHGKHKPNIRLGGHGGTLSPKQLTEALNLKL